MLRSWTTSNGASVTLDLPPRARLRGTKQMTISHYVTLTIRKPSFSAKLAHLKTQLVVQIPYFILLIIRSRRQSIQN